MKHHGERFAIEWLKALQLHLTRYVALSPLCKSDTKLGLTSDGLPKIFKSLIPFIAEGDLSVLRMLMTLLTSSRLITGNGDLDHTNITQPLAPHDINALVLSLTEFFRNEILPRLETSTNYFKWISKLSWFTPHFTAKSGPQGGALITALQDLLALPDVIRSAIIELGGSALKYYMTNWLNALRLAGQTNDMFSGVIRKIVVIRDKGLKNRPIAVFDYWSQTCLLQYHDLFMKLLTLFPMDMTFRQGLIKDLVKE